MKNREKLLAGLVGTLAIILVAVFVGDSIVKKLGLLKIQIQSAQKKKGEQDVVIKKGEIAAERLRELETRALPMDRSEARTVYKNWLHDIVERVSLVEPNVSAVSERRHPKDVYSMHTFNVTGKGNVGQLTEFLYEFYSVDYLHRFRNVTVRPIPNTKLITLTFQIEALSLPGAPQRERLNGPIGDVKLASLDSYLEAIADRNPFSPENKAPKLTVSSTVRVPMGESLSLTPEATDAEEDRLYYDADLEDLPNARVDERTGRVSWRPTKLGEYVFVLYVSDNGFPSQTTSKKITVSVVEPRVADVAPQFNTAQLAFVTGITSSRGRRQVWLSVRNEGKVLKLHEGDSFSVGQVKGVVKQINRRHVMYESEDGKVMRVLLGDNLAQAAAAAAGPGE